MSRIIDKMTDFWRVVLEFSQYQKCTGKVSWVSCTLVTQLRNYKLLYFGIFTEIDVMSEERPKLSRKRRTSGKTFWILANAKSVQIKVPEYLGHWLRDSEVVSPFILKVLLRVAGCQINAPNYQQNDGLLGSCSKF